jgi:hypothetical protein
MLLWIDSIRTEANASGIEFALAPQIMLGALQRSLGFTALTTLVLIRTM